MKYVLSYSIQGVEYLRIYDGFAPAQVAFETLAQMVENELGASVVGGLTLAVARRDAVPQPPRSLLHEPPHDPTYGQSSSPPGPLSNEPIESAESEIQRLRAALSACGALFMDIRGDLCHVRVRYRRGWNIIQEALYPPRIKG